MAKVIDKAITDFIQRRFPTDSNWLSGNCYYFAIILRERFGGKILYDVLNGHFVTEIYGVKYDWQGVCDNGGIYLDWETFEDAEQKQRIIRDCVR